MTMCKYNTQEDAELLDADSPEEAVQDWFDNLMVGEEVPETITVHRFKRIDKPKIRRVLWCLHDMFDLIDEDFGSPDCDHCVTLSEERVYAIAEEIRDSIEPKQYDLDGEEEVRVYPCLDQEDAERVKQNGGVV